MSGTPTKIQIAASNGAEYKTPKKQMTTKGRPRSASLKSIENLTNSEESSAAEVEEQITTRRSARKPSPTKKYQAFRNDANKQHIVVNYVERSDNDELQSEDEEDVGKAEAAAPKPNARDLQLIQADYNVAGTSLFGFNTPKKRDAMAIAAINATPCTPKTPKTPKTPRLGVKTPDTKRKKVDDPKTPSHVRTKVKQRKCFPVAVMSIIFTFFIVLQK